MSESKQDNQEAKEPQEKKGFFGRIFEKVDASMKQKADEKSQQSCCGGKDGKDGKGGKCC